MRLDLIGLAQAVEEWQITHDGEWPATLDELVIPSPDGWTYLKQSKIPLDPWKGEYFYEVPTGSRGGRIVSFGADGAPGGEGHGQDVFVVIEPTGSGD